MADVEEGYGEDNFEDEEEAQQQQMLASSARARLEESAERGSAQAQGRQSRHSEEQKNKGQHVQNDALDLGDDYEEDDEADQEEAGENGEEGEMEDPLAESESKVPNQYQIPADLPQNQVRLNSQQNYRAPGLLNGVEGHGRPLTKHQQRSRISASQGGPRGRRTGGKPGHGGPLTGTQPPPYGSGPGFNNMQIHPNSYAQNAYFTNNSTGQAQQLQNGWMGASENFQQDQQQFNNSALLPGQGYNGLDMTQNSYPVAATTSGNQSVTEQAPPSHFSVPIKPMYGGSGTNLNYRTSAPGSKGGSRRQVIQQIIHNNGSGNILFSGGNLQQSSEKRRRMATGNGKRNNFEYFTAQQSTAPGQGSTVSKIYQPMLRGPQEREEIKNAYRNLKIQFNITKDENTRLRTRLQAFTIDLQKKEKDIENCTRQLQQQAGYIATGSGQPVSQKTNYLESFLVQQLKKQNRNLKTEAIEKDRLIEELKKNVKLSKHKESDNEVQAYVEECLRLRTLLEQTMIQNESMQQQQNSLAMQEDGANEDNQRLQEALFAQEAQLNEQNVAINNLNMELIQEKELKSKMMDKFKTADSKARKYIEALNEGKRKHKIIQDKTTEMGLMREQLERFKAKASQAERIYTQNKDLVTRKCGLESGVQSRDKKIQEMTDKIQNLESVIRKQESITGAGAAFVTAGTNETTKVKAPPKQQSQRRPIQSQVASLQNKPVAKKAPVPEELPSKKASIRESVKTKQSVKKEESDYEKDDFDESQKSPVKVTKRGSAASVKKSAQKSKSKSKSASKESGVRNSQKSGKKSQFSQEKPAEKSEEKYEDEFEDAVLKKESEPSRELTRVAGDKKKEDHDSDSYSDDGGFGLGNLSQLKQAHKESEKQFNKESDNEEEPEQPVSKDVANRASMQKSSQQTEPAKVAEAVLKEGPQQDVSQDQEEDPEQEYEKDQEETQYDENQMLDIAEEIFNMISRKLVELNLTVRETFGGDDMIHVLEEFERETNVEVMTQDDFFTRCEEIGVDKLTNVQIECLMRVLGKQELSGAIRLNELEILMANFGPQEAIDSKGNLVQDGSANALGEEQPRPATNLSDKPANGKTSKKIKKKKQIANLLEQNDEVQLAIAQIISIATLDKLEEQINQRSQMQPVKSKNKQSTVSVIRKEELMAIFKAINPPEGISEAVINEIEPLVFLNPKFPTIYQVKNIGIILSEVVAQASLQANGAQLTKAGDGAQVLSFKQLESDEN